jgi:hypothetical protein
MAMQLITGFEEEFATTDKPPAPPLKDFSQIPEALKYDFNVAENIFARGAKKELRQVLHTLCKEEIPNIRAADCLGTYPIWVIEMTVAFSVLDPSLGSYLSSAVRTVAYSIMNQIKDSTPAFVDSLQVKMSRVDDTIFQFRLKQKWTMTGSLKENTSVAP